MIENHRSGLIWKLFMSLPQVRDGMKAAGFGGGNRTRAERRPAQAGNPGARLEIGHTGLRGDVWGKTTNLSPDPDDSFLTGKILPGK
jgi:hypothetical protein